MRGWTKDGERVDLTPWQEEEIRAYMKWAWDRTWQPSSGFSRFMYSAQAVADENQVVANTCRKISEARSLYYSLKRLWDQGFEDVAAIISIYLEAREEFG